MLGSADYRVAPSGRHPDHVGPIAGGGRVEASEPLWRDVREIVLCLATTPATRCARTWPPPSAKPLQVGPLSEGLPRPERGSAAVRCASECRRPSRRAQWLAVPDVTPCPSCPSRLEPRDRSGIVGLKEHFRVRRGDLTVVTGGPRPRQNLVRQRGRLPPGLGPRLADQSGFKIEQRRHAADHAARYAISTAKSWKGT